MGKKEKGPKKETMINWGQDRTIDKKKNNRYPLNLPNLNPLFFNPLKKCIMRKTSPSSGDIQKGESVNQRTNV